MKMATIAPIRARTEPEIAQLISSMQQQRTVRKDMVIPAKNLRAIVENDEVLFTLRPDDLMPPTKFEPTWTAHEGIYQRFGIHRSYYEKMGDEFPDLMAYNINAWAERDERNFFVRTLDDKVRAIMSDRFRAMDSVDLFFTGYEKAKELGAHVAEVDVTEGHFYMRMVHPEWAEKMTGFRMNMQARRQSRDSAGIGTYRVLEHLDDPDDGGTWLVPGIILRNSDVGKGSLHAELFILDLICGNGMIGPRTIHQVHLGKQLDIGYISEETRKLEDQAIWSHVGDMITESFNREKFLEMCRKIQDSTTMEITEPLAAVEVVVKNYNLSETDQNDILNELLAAGSNTVYGLLSAVTAVGRNKSDADEATKFERAGGDILDDPRDFVRVRRDRKSSRTPAAHTA